MWLFWSQYMIKQWPKTVDSVNFIDWNKKKGEEENHKIEKWRQENESSSQIKMKSERKTEMMDAEANMKNQSCNKKCKTTIEIPKKKNLVATNVQQLKLFFF